MALNRKLIDGENEYVTITRIEPRFIGRNHLNPDMWVGHAEMDGEPLLFSIRNTREDRNRFLAAGYVPYDILRNVDTAVRITVLTAWDTERGWCVGEVIHATETVHSAQERDAAWKVDVGTLGKPTVTGIVATFARIGYVVVWTKTEAGRYVRDENGIQTVYEGKS